jgi:hypothetical protein
MNRIGHGAKKSSKGKKIIKTVDCEGKDTRFSGRMPTMMVEKVHKFFVFLSVTACQPLPLMLCVFCFDGLVRIFCVVS